MRVLFRSPLGPTYHRRPDRAHDDLGGDAMDGLPTWLPAAAWAAMVRAGRLANLLSAGLFLVVVFLRCLCPADLHRGRLYRRVRRLHLDCRRDRHVGLASA